MKRLALVLLLLAACHPGPRGPAPGASTARGAVSNFLSAVRAQDLQAMSISWGTPKGPARDVVDPKQIEKRELVMICYLNHDRYDVQSEAPAENGGRVFHIALSKGTLTRATNFFVVQGPSDRWYVESVDIAPLRDLCRSGVSGAPPGSSGH